MRFCWPQITFILLILVLGTAAMLSGCGKKGPLYIPPEPQEQPADNQQK